jgi:hypothetical protein
VFREAIESAIPVDYADASKVENARIEAANKSMNFRRTGRKVQGLFLSLRRLVGREVQQGWMGDDSLQYYQR